MMTSQSQMIEDTILSMKRVINKNKADAFSDSDSDPPKPTNRGHKLKRKSQYFHEGQMGGRRPYKRKIDHAGYKRYILHRNPKRYDEEGYELFDDDTDEEADEEAALKNPYNGIRIQSLLMPLAQAADLNEHPSLSMPYKSRQLPIMVKEACEMMHRERQTLINLKLLLAKFRGDPTWIPSGTMLGEDDASLFGTYPQLDGGFAASSLDPTVEALLRAGKSTFEKRNTEQPAAIAVNGSLEVVTSEPVATTADSSAKVSDGVQTIPPENSNRVKDESITADSANEIEITDHAVYTNKGPGSKSIGQSLSLGSNTEMKDTADEAPNALASKSGNKTPYAGVTNQKSNDASNINPASKSSNPPTPSAISSPGQSPPRMLTRGRANARTASAVDAMSPRPQSIPPSPASTIQLIHPLYLPPPNAAPSRDFGLPSPEAEDSRRILSAWVQKQEEVCRGAERLYEGLLKARRLRDTVWRWSRAEGHLGEMSDGEDWVDMEEWGLDAPLKKGLEDGAEEEGGKKTRGRRAGGG